MTDSAERELRMRERHPWSWWLKWSGLTAVVATLIVGVTLTAIGVIDAKKLGSGLLSPFKALTERKTTAGGEASDYSAVFLVNGQVYFGKMSTNDREYVLRDVYYLRAQRPLQPAEEESEGGQPRQQVQLIKLGNELHGPTDEIIFTRDNVLFVERLTKDSRVVKGIEQFKAGQ